MTCPGPLLADQLPEPLPPAGFTEADFDAALISGLPDGLGVDTIRWLMAEWRPWAREQAARAEKARLWCLEQQAKGKGP